MPDETHYSNRELDEKFERVAEVSNENRHSINNKMQGMQNILELRLADLTKNTADSLSRIELSNASIDAKVSYTNGKVRKIIIALLLLGGIVIGQNFGNMHDILQLLAGSVAL